MGRLTPMRVKTREESARVYAGVYEDVERFVNMKLKWRGIHSLIVGTLGRDLRDKTVLDVGCGFGRFSFLAGQVAREVVGLDMTEGALHVAGALKEALGAGNVEFVHSDVEGFDPGGPIFDVVYLGGVLEHLIEPLPVLARVRKMLAPRGTLVINCPAESNFRGDVATTLLKLFDFPMSLSDVRQVDLQYMREVCDRAGFRNERILGCMYSRGWTDMGARDLKERIPKVLEDVKEQVAGMRVQHDAFAEWVVRRAEENRAFIDGLVRRRILKRIPRRAELSADEEVLRRAGLPVQALRRYLEPDFSRDPYYSDIFPFCLMGGQAIYFLKRAD